ANHNVMADYDNIKVKNKDYIMSANVGLGIKLAPWLNFKSTYGYRGSFNKNSYHTPSYTPSIQDKVLYPENSETNVYWQEQIQENVLTFNKEFGRHDVTVMLGNSINATRSDWHTVAVNGSTGGFLDPDSETIDAGIGGSFSGEGSNYEYNRASFFGRVNYSFDHKYLLQVTARRDGSSKFGSDRRWGFFPSVAIGWAISEEGFFPKDGLLNSLKFRASWGRLGNESALGYYDFQTLVTTVNKKSQGYVQGDSKTPWPGSISTGMANNDLQWETTDSKNIGFDYGLLNNRLTGSVNYYNSTTSDLLITKVLAPSAGLDDPTLNVGKIRNSGFEIDLKWNETKGEITYGIGMNLSTTKNRVLELANQNQVLYGTGLKYGDAHFPTQTRVGEPIGAYYLYQMDGIFQSDAEVQNHFATVDGQKVLIQPDAAAGDIRFKDMNGDGQLTEDDMVYSGSGIPTLEANLLLNLGWKGFDFSATIGSAWGSEIYNGTNYFYEAMSAGSNFLSSTLNAWTESNHSNTMPRAILSDPNGNTRESTRYLEKGDFVKIRQIQLGYTLPKALTQKMQLERLRVYASVNNLCTFTGYSGIDPEFSRKSVLDTGVDNYIFPFTRSYLFGVQLSF
ncbi:MAG: SusC/RagA family TonB-linked outer membrane protein, partial [Negativicutes bacterium]|nr:SusC/RagA family TonB-linked outer membrane protein [Negativicutes bacterium]